jgi:hypothetical protein
MGLSADCHSLATEHTLEDTPLEDTPLADTPAVRRIVA